ncbi:MAG: hypothetical protein M1827_003631 [Pycnora praestabilis]|nr:MAG: hypothetical protein M1827_003631 [Pycnora praestabilis]
MVYRTLKELDITEGTVRLYESYTEDNARQHLGHTGILLVPQPSKDPNDPLNWPTWKKYVAFGNICAFTFFVNYSIGGFSPAFYSISLEFRKPMATVSDLLIWPVLVLGLGNFFWVPVALYLGKRPVFVVALLVLLLSNTWAAVSRSFGSLLGSRIVAAFVGSSTEALGAAIVNDIFFLHERSTKLSFYIICLSWGNSMGPLCCGFTVSALGWRWYAWISTILTGVNFLSVFLFFPETRFDRRLDQQVDPETSIVEESKSLDKAPVASAITRGSGSQSSGESLRTRKSYLQELNPWSGIARGHSFLHLFMRPFPLVLYPAVCWAFLSYSIILASVVAINILAPFILQTPPYNFSPAISGLTGIPGIIGNLVGGFMGGYFVDVYSRWRAHRNPHGTFEPESRLPLVILPWLIVPVGLLMFGYGTQDELHWAVMFVGYGFVSVGLTAGPNIGMTYVLDSYYPVAAEALLVVNGLKNVVAFGFLYGIAPWVAASGYAKVSIVKDCSKPYIYDSQANEHAADS